MPAGSVFIDSNVLLYTRERTLSPKGDICGHWLRELARSGRARTNLQVLNEVTHVMLRKRQDLDEADIFSQIDQISFLGRAPIDSGTVLLGKDIRLSTRYSWWDCLLLASALELGCSHFLSEDLRDGQVIAGLTIMDPFAHSPDEILLLP